MLWRSIKGLLVACGVYVLLLLFPQPLFPYRASAANIAIWSSERLPAEIQPILEEAHRRISTSPLFDPADQYRVYLCQTDALFTLFANYKHRVGGVTYAYFNQNVFLRPSHVARNRLLGPSGSEVPGDRTLVYFISHELTHAMTARAVGRLSYSKLGPWRLEGYADYVGKGEPLDVPRWAEALRSGDIAMDPSQSGLYNRYHLVVAYLLDRQHFTVKDLMSREWDVEQIESELRDLTKRAQPGGTY